MRAFTSADASSVVDLVVSAGLFTRQDAAFLAAGALEPADGSTCVVDDAQDGAGLASVLFYRPEDGAERAFDLTMIAVRPDLRGKGAELPWWRTPSRICASGGNA